MHPGLGGALGSIPPLGPRINRTLLHVRWDTRSSGPEPRSVDRPAAARPVVATRRRRQRSVPCRRWTRSSRSPLTPAAPTPRRRVWYWRTKLHALNGGRDKLSRRDLDFVGVDTWPINTPGGWHAPTGLFLDLWSDLPELPAEVAAGLHALVAISTVDVNRERLEFLG